jgi:ABC-type branched-subunit amino acid transport system ATPase component
MSTPAIAMRGVEKSFGPTKIIRGVDLEIARGERHAMIGPNGAGKTTLFNLISGRFPISSGTIALNGQSIDGLAPHQINRLGLSRSFQITSIFPRLSVFENIRCGSCGRAATDTRSGTCWAARRRSTARPSGSSSSSASPTAAMSRPGSCPMPSNARSRSASRWRAGPTSSCSMSRPRA